MAKLTKRCRVCGKDYEACKSIKTGSSTFNWREVACSPECGMEYLRLVNMSRGASDVSEPVPTRESMHSTHRGKSKKSAEAENEAAEADTFTPAATETAAIWPEYTEE